MDGADPVSNSFTSQSSHRNKRNHNHASTRKFPLCTFGLMQEIISESLGVRSFQLTLASLFGFFALLLAALGIYGVVGYSVARGRQELGIRMALGANRSDLQNLVLLQGMSPVLADWIAGTAASGIAGFLIRS